MSRSELDDPFALRGVLPSRRSARSPRNIFEWSDRRWPISIGVTNVVAPRSVVIVVAALLLLAAVTILAVA